MHLHHIALSLSLCIATALAQGTNDDFADLGVTSTLQITTVLPSVSSKIPTSTFSPGASSPEDNAPGTSLPEDNAPRKPPPTGAIVGAVVGVLLCLCAGMAVFLWRRRKKRQQPPLPQQQWTTAELSVNAAGAVAPPPPPPPPALLPTDAGYEKESAVVRPPLELPASHHQQQQPQQYRANIAEVDARVHVAAPNPEAYNQRPPAPAATIDPDWLADEERKVQERAAALQELRRLQEDEARLREQQRAVQERLRGL